MTNSTSHEVNRARTHAAGLICYRGPDLLLAHLIYRPANSLDPQSFHALDRPEPLNGDGFGVDVLASDYRHPRDTTSTMPAWSNQNLRRLSRHGDVRLLFCSCAAASPGMRVTLSKLSSFPIWSLPLDAQWPGQRLHRIKRRLRGSLPDSIYDQIEGTTDFEHAFGLFLHALDDTELICSAKSEMAEAMV